MASPTGMDPSINRGTPADPALGQGGLVRLLAWLSPAFPVGGYTYSHGIERAVEEGTVTNGPSARRWIEAALAFGPARVDADLLREAWRAGEAHDWAALERALILGETMRGTPELALESLQQGESFLATVAATWPHPALAPWVEQVRGSGRSPAYPIAVALAAVAHAVPLEPTLAAYLHAFAGALVSAAVRLVPLGQTTGQATPAALEAAIHAATQAALTRKLEDIGTAAPMIDLWSIAHETQHVRLFRS